MNSRAHAAESQVSTSTSAMRSLSASGSASRSAASSSTIKILELGVGMIMRATVMGARTRPGTESSFRRRPQSGASRLLDRAGAPHDPLRSREFDSASASANATKAPPSGRRRNGDEAPEIPAPFDIPALLLLSLPPGGEGTGQHHRERRPLPDLAPNGDVPAEHPAEVAA